MHIRYVSSEGFFMRKKFLIYIAIAFALALVFTMALDNQQKNLSEKLIRLHVVGATDSQEDQKLKLKVKDEIVSQVDMLLAEAVTKADAVEILNENMDLIAAAAIRAADAEGESISVRCSLEIESFPTRQYDTFSLPAGKYTSLRVIIDQGQGHNWWCVIYPKVCSDTVVEKEDFQELGLSEDETDLITESGTEYKIKFKLLEVIEEIKTALFDK